jgi:serine/threonine-protein kinase
MSQSKPQPQGDPAEIAGRYQIVQRLGAGAFGTVYKAKDRILGRMVAIKTIRLDGLAAAGTSLQELVDRFEREARVSAMLKHPNIVTIHDLGTADGLSYLAMEFIDGVGLEKVIAGSGRLGVERAASIASQVADALDFAHKNGVVHRDIKPANIMIEAGDRVKVTDFGIAKVTTSGEHLTMTGSLLGTPSYMSPEQARGGAIDGRSDLFSVGCVLYEMLGGQKAFRGESITALIFKIITEEPQSIRALDPSVPEAIGQIIARALAKTPEARYQTGRELVDALHPFVRAGATPTLRQAETPTSRSSPAIPATVVGAAATRVSAAPPTQAAPPQTQPAPPPQPPPAPRPAASVAPRPAPVAAPRKAGAGLGLLVALGLVALLFAGAAAGGFWYFVLRKTSGAETAQTDVTPTLPPPPSAPATATLDAPAATLAAEPPPGEPAATLAAEAPAATMPVTRPPADAERPDAPIATRAPATPAAAPAAPPDMSFLDSEPPQPDGAAAGQRLAQSYRSQRGSPAGPFGASGRFRARERSPRNLAPSERPAVAVTRHVMNAQELYRKRNARYATFQELAAARLLFLDVPIQAPREFVRKGYRFELTLAEGEFRVLATPLGPGARPFLGDDSGFIRDATDE